MQRYNPATGRFESPASPALESPANLASEPLQPLAAAWDSLPDLVTGDGVVVPMDWTPGWDAARAGAPILMLTSVQDLKRINREQPISVVFPFEGQWEGEKFVFDKDNETTLPLYVPADLAKGLSIWFSRIDKEQVVKLDTVICTGHHGREPFLKLIKSLLEAEEV